MLRQLTILALTLSTSWLARPAAAQEPMTPTATQRAYNDRGVQHMFDGEYDQAAANFKSSLSLGESNIAWLNYGRAMFKLKRCHEAQEAFSNVPTAPTVDAPSPAEIATVLDRFAEEWGGTCTGRLTLECPDDPTMVRIDASDEFACHPNPIPVVPGVHNVFIEGWDQSFAVEVASEPTMLSLQRSLTPPPTETEDSQPISLGERAYASRGGPRRLIGLSLAAAGVAALGTGLALEAAWVAPAFRDYEAAQTPEEWQSQRDRVRTRQRANRILLFSGLGVAAIGTTLFVIPNRDGSETAVKLGVSGASVSAEVTW